MDSANTAGQTPALGPRRLQSWIESFHEYTEVLPSPSIFRTWAAIAAVAGALERKVWVRTLGSNLYPNIYAILVAGPGVGKTVALAQTEHMWRQLPDHHVAPTSLTKAALIDALNDAKRKIIRPTSVPPFDEFNSLLIMAGELGVLVPGYDNDFMNTLTAIYDGHPYAERRRTKDLKLGIPYPQLNIIGATTPSYLNQLMPEGAWDQGFISRTLLVYSGERVTQDLFLETGRDDKLEKDLIHDLKIIGGYYGKVAFDPEAAAAISAWHKSGGPPQPDHPKLTHYLTRRTAHLLKLCMVSAASAGDPYTIWLHNYQEALGWLLEMEKYIPDIFRSMNTGGDGAVIEEAWHFMLTTWIKEKKPVAEHRLVYFLREKTPSHNVMKIIEIMVKSQIIKADLSGGTLAYLPTPRVAR